MYAQRALIETDAQGRPVSLPPLPPNTRLDAIFLVVEPEVVAPVGRRTPPAALRGSVEFLGDIVAPVSKADEWDALQ